MKLILLGPPGAGKGTHAEILSKKYRTVHLAAGEIFRRHIRQKSPLGLKAKGIIEKGSLVPDDLVNEMMIEEIRSAGIRNGFILDGYPRTLGQAEALGRFLKGQKTGLDAALNFATSEDVIIDRLSGRRVCEGCGRNYHVRNIPPRNAGVCDRCGMALVQRKDDEPGTIRHRLKTYETETYPLIDYYGKEGILHEVPADDDVEELQARLQELLRGLGLGK